MKNLRLPCLLTTLMISSPLLFSPLALAQTDPVDAQKETSKDVQVYTPTSLVAEPGLPRTPDGRPDFQGAVWATNFFPVFDTNPMTPNLIVPEEEAKMIVATMFTGMAGFLEKSIDPEAAHIMGDTDGLPLVRGERRTRLVVLPADGALPLTAEAKAMIEAADKAEDRRDDYEQRPTGERCLVLSGNPPIHAVVSYNRLQAIQPPEYVVVHSENGDEARIIPFATEHAAAGPTSWYGDSIARWDGDTLVLETIRNSPHERVRGLMAKFVVNPDAKVIERYTRLSVNELLYQFTIEDPSAYSAPWLAEFSFYSTTTGMYPSPCHEHNHSLPNILMGQRVADRHAGH
ncbi:MAG: hypothetical protein ABMA14_14575 [Hyphomonadaceae bacterium]